jgi:hypothetical protein
MRKGRYFAALFVVILASAGCQEKKYCNPAVVAKAAASGDAEAIRREILKPIEPAGFLGRWLDTDTSYATVVNRLTGQMKSPDLHLAAWGGHAEAVRVLLEQGVSANLLDTSRTTALPYAVMSGHNDVAALLLQHGSDPNATGQNGPVLGDAVVAVNTALVKMLLEKGANPNSVGPNGPVLNTAIGVHNAEIVQMLLDKGADPNAKGDQSITGSDTPTCRAALGDDPRILKLLLEKRGDANQHCVGDAPPIYTVEKREFARILLNAGAKVETARLWMQCSRPELLRMLVAALPPEDRLSATFILKVACR